MKTTVSTEPLSLANVYAGTWMNISFDGSTLLHFKAGDVVRMNDWINGFADAVILGFDKDGNSKLARPYLYASSVGTTGPSALTGHEIIDRVTPQRLGEFWTKIGTGRIV